MEDASLPRTIPPASAREVEETIAETSQRMEISGADKSKTDANTDRTASHFNPGEVECVIAARYEGMDPVFALKHRRRLEEFLEQSGEEYRTASVVFLGISFSGKSSDETIRKIMDSFYAVCAQAVDRNIGFVVKYEADACLAVFGAPVAYDRDAESAVRAALEIRETVQLFPVVEGINAAVSAGVATGTILSSAIRKHGRCDFDVFGYAVNLAVRLKSAADKGVILACPDTYDLAQNAFDFRRKFARHFKNVAEPIVTYEVLSARKAEEVKRRDFSTPFFGRESQMATLSAAWDLFLNQQGSNADSSLSGVIVSGAPGMGKSRLLIEFLKSIGSRAKTVHTESSPHDVRMPYAMWRLALTRLWGGSREDPSEKIEADLLRYLNLLGAEGKRLALAGGPIGLRAMFGSPAALEQAKQWKPGVLRSQMQSDLGALLDIAGSRKPLILVLDDLQWADRSSLDLLEGLAAPPAPRGVFFILAHRTRFKIPGARLANLDRIILLKLDDASRDALFAHLISIHHVLPDTRAGLLSQSSGNPLFLVELVRCVLALQAESAQSPEEEAIEKRIQHWVPMSLRQLIESRLDLLDRRRRLVVQCGAVLGHRFAYKLINLFEMIRDGLLERLYSLKGLEFLDDIKTDMDLEFLFQHHLIRETAYQNLRERQRREYHRIVARGIEQTFASRLPENYHLLAYHFDQAQDREKAIHYLTLAGDRAYSQGASIEALEFYNSALKKMLTGAKRPDEEITAGALLRKIGSLQRFLGNCTLAFEAFDRALALPAVKSDPRSTATLHHEHALTHAYLSDYSAARKALALAAPEARKLKADSLLARIQNIRFLCSWGEGNLRTARKQGLKAVIMASEAGETGMEADARNNLALLEWKAGRLEEALEHFTCALQLWQKLGNRFGMSATRMNIGIAHENLGRYDEARKYYLSALEMAEQIRYVQIQSATLANLGNLCLNRAQWNESMDYNARSLELARAIGDRRSETIALENLALGNMGLARYKEAADAVREGRNLARSINHRERLFSLDLVEIELLLDMPQNSLAAARALRRRLEAAGKALKKAGYRAEQPRLLRLLVKAQILANDPRNAAKAFARALRECDRQKNLPEKERLTAMESEMMALKNSTCSSDSKGKRRK
ncbi:MAG TPA: AAA family ATPase [Candidatus Sumerlaeota bacterium]|nr:AAA family ATPase [Candidatus Sumerlaeota bacterium]